MSRIALAALLGLLGATAVLGAPEAIAERKKLMKENGAATRLGVQMVRGDVPFDLAKARAIFATYQKAGEQIPSLFPEDSNAGEETAAAPPASRSGPRNSLVMPGRRAAAFMISRHSRLPFRA
jgi:cytochrome c556